jgi:hypothetical protein
MIINRGYIRLMKEAVIVYFKRISQLSPDKRARKTAKELGIASGPGWRRPP